MGKPKICQLLFSDIFRRYALSVIYSQLRGEYLTTVLTFKVAKTQKANKNGSLIESYEIIENVVTTKAQHKEKKSLETKRDHKFNYSYCFVSNKNWNHKTGTIKTMRLFIFLFVLLVHYYHFNQLLFSRPIFSYQQEYCKNFCFGGKKSFDLRDQEERYFLNCLLKI